MNTYKADLHLHTVLSPCADLEMGPGNIIRKAKENSIDILGITDHNSTKQAKLLKELGNKNGIFVLTGAEVTTKEEIHCLAFFENNDELTVFEQYLDANIQKIKNNQEKFGYQVIVTESEDIVEEVDHLLISALNKSINEIERKVHELNGIFIPAHVDKPSYSLISQLGFIPDDLICDGIEISNLLSRQEFLAKHDGFEKFTIIRSSDAHHPDQIGKGYSMFEMDEPSFSEIKEALAGKNGKNVTIQ